MKGAQFTEQDVKALLVDLRELAKYVSRRTSGETNPFTRGITEFVDVCDFIAHATRDRGIIEENVRRHVRLLHSKVETATIEEFTSAPVEGVLNGDTLVAAMIGIASFAFSPKDRRFLDEYFSAIHEHKDEIALCILSLLHDSIIELKEEEGFAVLHLVPYEGLYRLYCRVVNSRIERDARSRTGGSGRLSINFPVIVSSAKCIDNFSAFNSFEFPPVVETYRDDDGALRVKVIDESCSA